MMASALRSRSTLARKLVPRSSMIAFRLQFALLQLARRLQRRPHDRAIAGAAAQMAREEFANLRLAGTGPIAQQRIERHQNARGAKSALQRVLRPKGFLQRRQAIRRRREALDGANFGAFRLDRKGEAGAGRRAVDLYRAGAADAVLAADMRAGCAKRVADEIAQQHARLG